MNAKSFLATAACSLLTFSIAHATQPVLDPSGATKTESKIAAMNFQSQHSQKGVEELLVNYPEIARDVGTLQTIDRAVWTDAGTIDLYAADKLLLILDKRDGIFVVRQSLPLFMPVAIQVTMMQNNVDLLKSLDFTFRGCTVSGQTGSEVETCESVVAHLDLEQIVIQ